MSETPTDGIDYGTPLGMVRLRIADTSSDPVLSDAQLRGLLVQRGVGASQADQPFQEPQRAGVVRAAADALMAIAVSETLVGKYIRRADGTTTDGTKVGAELRAHAAQLRAEADLVDEEAIANDGGDFGVIEFIPGRLV